MGWTEFANATDNRAIWICVAGSLAVTVVDSADQWQWSVRDLAAEAVIVAEGYADTGMAARAAAESAAAALGWQIKNSMPRRPLSYVAVATRASTEFGLRLECGTSDNHPTSKGRPSRWALFDLDNRSKYSEDDVRYDKGLGFKNLEQVSRHLDDLAYQALCHAEDALR